MGKKSNPSGRMGLGTKYKVILSLAILTGGAFHLKTLAGQLPKSEGHPAAVRYTDIRQAAGITFLQDATQSDEKYYLETMGTGVGWIDYDQDGLMDLYFVQSAATDIYKPPHPLRSALYRNNGDGTFTDVTEKAGVGGEGHYGQGVAVADYDNDGYPDLYVTGYGRAILYHNNGDGTFTDATFASGIGINSQYVCWGCGFLDYDNDGWPDILQVNGHVYPEIAEHNIGQTFKNPRLVYQNLGNGKFKDVSAQMGPGIQERFSSRGAAFGDFDNDGDIDALILNMNDLPSLLRNDGGNKNNWIKIKLIGTQCNRTAIGARVRVVTGEHSQMNEVSSSGSVMSASDLRLHFGLGKSKVVDLIEVKWPTTQKIERFTHIQANQILTIREGAGIVKAVPVQRG